MDLGGGHRGPLRPVPAGRALHRRLSATMARRAWASPACSAGHTGAASPVPGRTRRA